MARHSKYYIPRYQLNTQSQYFSRSNLSDLQLIKSAQALTDNARKRLAQFEKKNINEDRYRNLKRVYDKSYLSGKITSLTDKERRKYMNYLNELEEIMYERHTTVRETVRDYNRAVKDYNEKLNLNINLKQYNQLMKITGVIKKLKPDIDSGILVDLAHQYSDSTNGQSTLSKRRVLKLIDSTLDTQLKYARGNKKKEFLELREGVHKEYENSKRGNGRKGNNKPRVKRSKGNEAKRKKNRRYTR